MSQFILSYLTLNQWNGKKKNNGKTKMMLSSITHQNMKTYAFFKQKAGNKTFLLCQT